MGNPYLDALRQKYTDLRTAMEAVQAKAVEENRELTDEELTSVRGMAEQAEPLHKQISDLTEVELRNRKVNELAAQLMTDAAVDAVKNRSDAEITSVGRNGQAAQRVGHFTTQDRDPGHYARSSSNSFFGDLHRARSGDDEAARRLAEHNRALVTGPSNAGAGVVPPKWLTEEFELLARQGRALSSAVRNIGLGSDPRPITLPKQTAGTDSVVQEQTTEGAANAGWDADAWESDVDTVTPKPTVGIQTVSRQMLDMSSPAIDALIYGDLLAAYNSKIESKVGAALVTAAGTAVTTFATEADFNGDGATPAPLAASDAIVDASIAVRNARKLPADILAMGVARYGAFLKLKDANGRPLVPQESAGPMNVIGTGSVAVDGRLHGLGVIATDGISTGSYPESIVALRASDTILFESDVLRFRYEEVAGPENVKLGIWAYSAVIVRQSGKSAKRIVITAAA